jgi:cytochrome c oxidase cbb3-type subunit III
MRARMLVLVASTLVLACCGTRDAAPVEAPMVRPDKIVDFTVLYTENCAGCHGDDGKGGAARPLGDPVYLTIANASTIRAVTAKGVAGTTMPAFEQSAGGTLTGQQIDAIVAGIRGWAKPDALQGEMPPSYASEAPGDATRGAGVYEAFCSSCHGPGGRGGQRASSIVDPAYLSLVSEQGLRTTVIAGRPDLGSPDWRNDVAGKPMSAENVSDVVAWLVSQRPQVNARR